MWHPSRRELLQFGLAGLAAAGCSTIAPLGHPGDAALGQVPGQRPRRDDRVVVLNPRERVPLSFIIDDSTCLVNLNRFAIPQFAAIWNHQRYDQAWREMPHEIPDDFVRKFGQWCGERRIKGKYSIVPFPACVGRLDRTLPGWSQRELDASLDLVRTLMLPDWDIHPEMITHTLAIDTRTGHPYPEQSPRLAENWNFTDGKSVDQLADYISYALRILKNVGLPCEGITTPGGFAGRVRPELAEASWQAVRDVFQVELPHYFKYVIAEGPASVAPRVELAADLDQPDPKAVVSIIACTGDWTGGWDCSDRGDVDRFITEDLQRGRMVEVIERGEPAIMLCHWTGIYFNGEEVGFRVFQEAVRRMHARFDLLQWMKLSEIARYWAAKELTASELGESQLRLSAPFAAPAFTVRLPGRDPRRPRLRVAERMIELREVSGADRLAASTWRRDGQHWVACFDLPRGPSQLEFGE
ncbi:MAG: hypothetical protein J5I93_01660 [Pirellulaceae bacterium]|nr:hypothetical protein [Pirellulaceae bacterium]